MTLKLVKEIIILLLMTLATILLLTVFLSDYIPNNTYVPQAVSYAPSNNVQEELQKVIQEQQENQVILTREITESDLKDYQRNQEYTPGKVNPFSSASTEESSNSTTTGGTTTTTNSATNTAANSTGNSNSGTSTTNSGTTNTTAPTGMK